MVAERPAGLVCDPAYRLHRTGDFHPERPARVDAVVQGLHLAPRGTVEAEPLEGEDHPLQQAALGSAAPHDAQAIGGVAVMAEQRLHVALATGGDSIHAARALEMQ